MVFYQIDYLLCNDFSKAQKQLCFCENSNKQIQVKWVQGVPNYSIIEFKHPYEKEFDLIKEKYNLKGELKEKCENIEKYYSVKLKEEIRKVKNKYKYEIYQLEKENSFLRKVINTFQKTVDKFIH